MKLRTLVMTAAAMSFAACSSTPEPVEPIAEPVAAPIPAPMPQATQGPAPSTTQLPPPVTIAGPIPGSVEDFLYMSGGEGRVFFAYDQYDFSNSARDTLRRQAQWLQSYPNVTAVVEGNADERGTREYNLALAARRAESVKSFLVSQGVSPNRLTTVSYGKERPIDGRSNEEGWARNRNGHTNLMSGSIG